MIAPDEHLIVTRVLLGLFESGFFPAASYLLFTWYCRYEVQTRMGKLFCLDSRDLIISEMRIDEGSPADTLHLHSRILLRRFLGVCFLWTSCCGHRQHEWHRRSGWMEVDFHP
jgi:hypothetical protein